MKRWFLILPPLLLGAALLLDSDHARSAVTDALSLCAATVIPTLFPFFVVSSLLLALGFDDLLRPLCAPLMRPLFGLNGACALPLLAGFLGGYPCGARAAAQLYERGAISRGDAQRLLGFCNNCGVGFLLGFVGAGIFSSARVALALLLVQLISALLTGVILCRLPRTAIPASLPHASPMRPVSFSSSLTAAVSGALSSTLSVCAYVVFFRTLAALIPHPLRFLTLALEMVSAVAALTPDAAGFIAAAGITAWGGLSVHCQTMSIAGDLSLRLHTAGKILQTVLAILLAALIAHFL